MKPVNVNAFDILGDMVAATTIAFGAAVMRTADGTIEAPVCSASAPLDNILGIADLDLVEKDEDGFYSQYDIVPVITAGRVRVWVTSNESTQEPIEAGDYLELALLGGTNTLPVGVFQQMEAEGGSATGPIRTLFSLARALEDMALSDVFAGTISAKTLTVTDSSVVAVGDYIVLEDSGGPEAEMNRVAAIPDSTTITVQFTPGAITAVDYVHKLHQVEALLL